MRYATSLATTLALVAAVGCSSDSVTDNRTLIGLELAMTPSRDTLFLGGAQSAGTTKVAASATVSGKPVTLPGHVFESADTAIATISSSSGDATATVTAAGLGTTTVAVRVNGMRATTTIVVLPIVKSVTLRASASQALVRDTISLTAAALGWDGVAVPGQSITFASSSPTATISSTGRVIFSAPGTATITAKTGDASATIALGALAREFIGGGPASISSGLDATCGLLPLGRAFCFGKAPVTGIARDTSCFDVPGPNVGPHSCTLIPLPIAGALQLTSLAVGDSVACGLTAAGEAYCWGDQTNGQLGNGVSKPGTAALPVRVTGPLADAATFTQITAGHAHACALTSGGSAYCWGRDNVFQIGGNGDNINASSSTPIPAGGGIAFKSIAAGRAHTCALALSGTAYCWGDNRSGQLGRGIVSAPSDVALPVIGATFSQISASGDNTCGLSSGGSVYCWGANALGQAGQAVSASVASPAQVAGSGFTYVAVGGDHACALTNTGASCWGSNSYGQLGRGGAAGGSFPDPAPVAGARVYTALSSGSRTSCAVGVDGAYCWGSTIFGATGSQIQASAVTTPQKTAPPQ